MNSRDAGCFVTVLAIAAGTLCGGCAAVFPELGPPLKPAPAGVTLSPAPPEDVLYLHIKKAWIPLRTRDGREWSGGAPDPYAVVLVDGKELFRTPIQPHTHEPTWPDAPKANYRIAKRARLTVELWDDAAFQQHPICTKDAEDLGSAASAGGVTLVCDVGAKITLEVEPAHALFGLGFWYELRAQAVYVTRVLAESPAGRAALRSGQRILSVQGKQVSSLDEPELRSLINSNTRTGVVITVLEPNGKTRTAQLRDGPVYPLFGEDAPLD
jgi:hypothetical protein